MASFLEKFLNDRGYYKLVSSKYYLTEEDEELRIAPQINPNSKFDEDMVQSAVKMLLEGFGENLDRPRIKRYSEKSYEILERIIRRILLYKSRYSQ